MADRPILFSDPMVLALLRGQKTQTRRILKPQPSSKCGGFQKVFAEPPYFESVDKNGKPMHAFPDGKNCITAYPSIAFAVGDRLWVRETWQEVGDGYLTIFRADYPHCVPAHFENVPKLEELASPWRPSIFMPRKKSRLTLTVSDVRIERLQACSEADAEAEGIVYETADPPFFYVPGIWPHSYTAVGIEEPGGQHAARSYAKLWNHINGPGAWEANPWVMVLTFTVENRNIDA